MSNETVVYVDDWRHPMTLKVSVRTVIRVGMRDFRTRTLRGNWSRLICTQGDSAGWFSMLTTMYSALRDRDTVRVCPVVLAPPRPRMKSLGNTYLVTDVVRDLAVTLGAQRLQFGSLSWRSVFTLLPHDARPLTAGEVRSAQDRERVKPPVPNPTIEERFMIFPAARRESPKPVGKMGPMSPAGAAKMSAGLIRISFGSAATASTRVTFTTS